MLSNKGVIMTVPKPVLTMEYICLPVTTLSQEFMYKFNGLVNTEWKKGVISAINMSFPFIPVTDKMKDFAKKTAAHMIVNREDFGRDEIISSLSVNEVEVIRYEDDSKNKPGDTLKVVKTNTLRVEYLHLPAIDDEYHYLMRFVEPMATIWQYYSDSPLCRHAVTKKNGKLHQYIKHIGISEILDSQAKSRWLAIINESKDHNGGNVPKEIEWMFNMKDVVVERCGLVEVARL